jgi:hypothetical protein
MRLLAAMTSESHGSRDSCSVFLVQYVVRAIYLIVLPDYIDDRTTSSNDAMSEMTRLQATWIMTILLILIIAARSFMSQNDTDFALACM